MFKRSIILVLTALSIWALSGCTAINGFMNDNDAVVDIAVRQAVFRYIDAGETEADKDKRAASVVKAVRNVDRYLEGNPTAGPAVLLDVIGAQVKWAKLSTNDAALLRDVMLLIRHNLQNRQSEGLIDADALIAIRSVLETAVLTASML